MLALLATVCQRAKITPIAKELLPGGSGSFFIDQENQGVWQPDSVLPASLHTWKDVLQMKKYCTERSRQLHEQTGQYLVDGVGSYFHITSYGSYPIAMTSGKGSKLYDVDGNEYIDYILGFGPMILGYRNKAVDTAISPHPTKT